MKPLHLLEDKTWDQIMTVNLKSIFWMSKFTLPYMIEKSSGCIINNSSIEAMQGQMEAPAYAASKGAMIALTRQMACEYGHHKIRVNAVDPGCICTKMLEKSTDTKYAESNTPLGRLGSVDDVANAVIFLASRESTWITGQDFIVDGGMASKGGWAPLKSCKCGM